MAQLAANHRMQKAKLSLAISLWVSGKSFGWMTCCCSKLASESVDADEASTSTDPYELTGKDIPQKKGSG